MALSHAFSNAVADGSLTAVVQPSDWNAAHTIGAYSTGNGLIPIGGVLQFAGLIADIPSGYLLCNGASLLQAGTYADLYAAIGTMFGGDGTHFSLPDLRDRFVVGGKEDDGGIVKTNIRGSLEQSYTATGVSLTHDGSVSDHTGLTHAGVSVAGHPDLTHAALGVADDAQMTHSLTIADHVNATRILTAAAQIARSTVAHAITHPVMAARAHTLTQAGTHTLTNLTHNVDQPAAHGAAGTVSHSFTPPAPHTNSIVPAFLALAMVIRFA
jgi:microcystin-dependent protein